MRIQLPDPLEFIHSIHQIYPQLVINSLWGQDGQSNDVFILDDQWVFRFPKIAAGIDILKREVALLRQISEHITLAIPNPIFQHLDTTLGGKAFVGYQIIPGQPLWLENFEVIHDPAAIERMAHQLATFLRELHSIPIASLQELNLPIADQIEEWHDLYKRIKHNLFPYMRTDAKRRVTDHFETYFANANAHHFDPVLRHGDFGTGNLLYDSATLTISGIIDFGATTLGDPAVDFAGLFSFGEDFCRHCYAVYPELEGMLERVQFYQGTFALQEAILGLETGNILTFRSGIERYR